MEGGGRGMRIVRTLEEIPSNFDSCKRESKNAFGRDEVFIEEFWEQTKHLEVQVSKFLKYSSHRRLI